MHFKVGAKVMDLGFFGFFLSCGFFLFFFLFLLALPLLMRVFSYEGGMQATEFVLFVLLLCISCLLDNLAGIGFL